LLAKLALHCTHRWLQPITDRNHGKDPNGKEMPRLTGNSNGISDESFEYKEKPQQDASQTESHQSRIVAKPFEISNLLSFSLFIVSLPCQRSDRVSGNNRRKREVALFDFKKP
jgi:hypothetical protein